MAQIDQGTLGLGKKKKKKKGKGGYLGKNFNPMSPRSGKQARRYIKAATRKQFRPLSRQLKREEEEAAEYENTKVPAYFAGYQNDLSLLRGQGGNAYAQAAQNTQAASQQAGEQDAANRAAIQERLQADATRRGTTVDPNIDIGQANAESARANLRQSMVGTLQSQGANQHSYMTNRMGAVKQGELEARQDATRRRLRIGEDRRELAKAKGDFRVELLDKIIESERKYGLEKGALGIDKGKLGLDRAKHRESKRSNRAGENIDRLEEKKRNKRNRRDDKTRRRGQDEAGGKKKPKQKLR